MGDLLWLEGVGFLDITFAMAGFTGVIISSFLRKSFYALHMNILELRNILIIQAVEFGSVARYQFIHFALLYSSPLPLTRTPSSSLFTTVEPHL